MTSVLNGVKKGSTVGRAAVPDTLVGMSRCCSTSTSEGLLSLSHCGTAGENGLSRASSVHASPFEVGCVYDHGGRDALG